MGRHRNPVVTARIEQVVAAWNKGDKRMPEIVADMGITVNAGTDALWEARQRGLVVRDGSFRKSETTRLRIEVVKLFNGGHTQAQIGERLGITRGVAGRLIAEARKAGIETVRYTSAEAAYRTQQSIRETLGEEGYHKLLSDAGRRGQASYRARLGDKAYDQEMRRRLAIARQAKQQKNQAAGPPAE